MSANDPLDPALDADRTMLVPTPGGRRPPSPAAGQAAPAAVYAAAAGAVAATYPAGEARTSIELHGSGLNPIVRAANPLLDLVVPLRHMVSHPDVEGLRAQLVHAIKNFESELRARRIDSESIAAARYALCTFLDETISSTPWGGNGVWASRSLLVAFHNEAWGGEKVFMILHRLSQDPRAHLHLLELMYLCLALGLEGRYRVLEGGRDQLETLRDRLHHMIENQRGHYEHDLSLRWRGSTEKRGGLLGVVPVWVLASVAGVFLVILHLVLSYLLNNESDPVFASLHQIKVERLEPPAPTVEVVAPLRLAKFLAEDIERGLVTVNETAGKSTVTLRGDGVFPSGSAEVAREFEPLMQRIGDALKAVPGKVVVVGHTDNVRGFSARYPSNWELSKARAGSVLKLLAERAGPPDRYSVVGRGETEPLVPNDTPANRARNRRVDIILLTPAAAL
ncbi:DotU family type VI secretion system protein [Noviherbaspirillum sp.]|uniref:DotU family type VI secretion system protein n=1 Tax=Noviherbaspirillum sp. TaxID=1926288 RepID=UPI002FE06264